MLNQQLSQPGVGMACLGSIKQWLMHDGRRHVGDLTVLNLWAWRRSILLNGLSLRNQVSSKIYARDPLVTRFQITEPCPNKEFSSSTTMILDLNLLWGEAFFPGASLRHQVILMGEGSPSGVKSQKMCDLQISVPRTPLLPNFK